MKHERKEQLKNWLLTIMIVTLIGSFVLIFMGYYMAGFLIGGILMSISTFLSQWSSGKSADYLFRGEYQNRRNNKW
ncbi:MULTISPECIES: hypothetical protein [unclassified Cytobacillus]|uniref:hypothetical protein n=1 Tax=unclassified Cytobacillus TaxID=2675268 RepID=UPI00135A62B6|nr:hypothetical protein [Cytobacillus sp. AMY 15.2]KAF0820917.1 hypothetical protein KIS4809_0444 [Bacillus sp. ZZV12-4809]MCM3090890.1 hypothetical protein [Cytobacillus sp. AMY 15.2]